MFISSPPFGYAGTDDRVSCPQWHPPEAPPHSMPYREYPYHGFPPAHLHARQRSRSRNRSRSGSEEHSAVGASIKPVDTVSALWSSPRLSRDLVRDVSPLPDMGQLSIHNPDKEAVTGAGDAGSLQESGNPHASADVRPQLRNNASPDAGAGFRRR
nr:hypothetical protein B0A51_08024 [Rachicladosporium sp. CCFEE 5018]